MVAIFVILTILLFLGIDLLYQRIIERKAGTANQNAFKSSKPKAISAISVPDGLFFHPGHSWASVREDGRVLVGMDDFTNKLFGNIDSIEVKYAGGEIKQGDPLIVIRKGERTAEIPAPVDGRVELVNTAVAGNPADVKNSPYNDGWICVVKPVNLLENLKRLNIAESAKEWARKEVDRLQDFLSGTSFQNPAVGQTLQDGGAPVEGVLEYISDDGWENFTSNFLKNKEN